MQLPNQNANGNGAGVPQSMPTEAPAPSAPQQTAPESSGSFSFSSAAPAFQQSAAPPQPGPAGPPPSPIPGGQQFSPPDEVAGPPNLGPDIHNESGQSPVQPPYQQYQQPPQQPDFISRLQQAGFDTSRFQSEDDAIRAFVDQQQQLQALQPYAQYGQQLIPYAQQFREFLASQQQPAQPAQQQEPETKKSLEERLQEHWRSIWNAPEYDPTWERMVQLNPDTGMYEGVSPVVPANVVQQMNQYRDWQRQSIDKLLRDPFSLQWNAMRPGIEDVTREIIQQELASYAVSRDFQNLDEEYGHLLYETDARGQRVVDPWTNEYKRTPFGDHVVSEMQRLSQVGVSDPYASFQYAVSSAKAMLYDQMSRQSQPAQPGQPSPNSYGAYGQIQNPFPNQSSPSGQFANDANMQVGQPFAAASPPFPGATPGGQQVPSPAAAPFQPNPYQGVNLGVTGQMPVGGGFYQANQQTPPQQSFLDRARNIASHSPQYGGAGQAASPSGNPESFNSEDFFSREAARLGAVQHAA